MDDLVVLRPQGLYCPPGDFYIDPWRPVPRAVLTHAHADHARAGHAQVLATAISAGVLRSRLGASLNLQGLAYGEAVVHQGVRISLHPAGHVLGSAQVRLEHAGRVWVASGDYFLSAHDERNPTCEPFEPQRCHCFITESTFGLPVYRWRPQAEVQAEINAWWRANAAEGRPSLLMAYSFGKAQRVLAGVDPSIGPIFVHGAVLPLNAAYCAAGVPLPDALPLPDDRSAGRAQALRGALVVAPPAVHASAWARKLGDFSDAFASGWMQLRGARRRQGVDRGFVLSDHADWPGLQRAIGATGAERVIVTHGQEAVMVRWLREQGLDAGSFHTEYGAEGGRRGRRHPVAAARARCSHPARLMRRFAALYAALDASTSTDAKVHALVAYLAQAPAADAAWAVYFLAGGRPRQTVPTALLRAEATALAGIPDWLFEASYQAVGDLAETIAQVLPPPTQATALGLAEWMLQRLLPLRGEPAEAQAAALRRWWDELPAEQRFLLVKLIGGGFRVGVSKLLVQRALARHAGLDPKLVAQRMMGWTDARQPPTADRLAALLAPVPPAGDGAAAPVADGQPYPFFLAHALEDGPPDALAQRLGPVHGWQAEWKYDGIRAQLVKRGGQLWIWSRGEELVSERFPEVLARAASLPDGCVLDGELLAWAEGDDLPAPFQRLQQRIQRKVLSRKLLAEVPVRFIAYDLLELGGQDLRTQPLAMRRTQLEALLDGHALATSPLVQAADWAGLAALRQHSRARGVEGLMLKQRASGYGSGRTKADGLWWKWKIAPHTVDAVLVYAQAGHGRRAGLYTDYSFAVWSRPPAGAAEADAVVQAIAARQPAVPGALQLLTFAKAYSGLSDAEFKAVDAVIRGSTLEKFGPVRSLRPSLVFELAFEGIARSPRHKSGVALRFPRMLRIRHDKPLWQADSLGTLEALIAESAAPG